MVQKRNEVRDGALEIDVVFPERVVGIDQQGLRAISNGLRRHSLHDNARLAKVQLRTSTTSLLLLKFSLYEEFGVFTLPAVGLRHDRILRSNRKKHSLMAGSAAKGAESAGFAGCSRS